MRVVLGSDHAGFDLKQDLSAYLQGLGHTVADAVIKRMSEKEGGKLTVVTSDRDLGRYAASCGAVVIDAGISLGSPGTADFAGFSAVGFVTCAPACASAMNGVAFTCTPALSRSAPPTTTCSPRSMASSRAVFDSTSWCFM